MENDSFGIQLLKALGIFIGTIAALMLIGTVANAIINSL